MFGNSFVIVLALAVSACSPDPEAAQQRREVLMQAVFPDPADRTGLDLVFPMESAGQIKFLEFIFDPAVISQNTVMARANKHCSQYGKTASIQRGPNTGSRTLPDGTKSPRVQIWTECV